MPVSSWSLKSHFSISVYNNRHLFFKPFRCFCLCIPLSDLDRECHSRTGHIRTENRRQRFVGVLFAKRYALGQTLVEACFETLFNNCIDESNCDDIVFCIRGRRVEVILDLGVEIAQRVGYYFSRLKTVIELIKIDFRIWSWLDCFQPSFISKVLDTIRCDSFYHKLGRSFERGWISLEKRIFQLRLQRFWILSDLRFDYRCFYSAPLFNFCTEGPISWFVDSSELWAKNNELINAKFTTGRQALPATLNIARLVKTYRKC